MDFDILNDPEDDNDDWLSSLRSESEFTEGDASGSESEEDTPDWLSNIREAESQEKPISSGDSGIDVDDWLSNIREQEAQSQDSSGGDSSDFLDRIQDLQAKESAPKPAGKDWLSGLESDQNQSEEGFEFNFDKPQEPGAFSLDLGGKSGDSEFDDFQFQGDTPGEGGGAFSLNLGGKSGEGEFDDFQFQGDTSGEAGGAFSLNLGGESGEGEFDDFQFQSDTPGEGGAAFSLNLGGDAEDSEFDDFQLQSESPGEAGGAFSLDLGGKSGDSEFDDFHLQSESPEEAGGAFSLDLGGKSGDSEFDDFHFQSESPEEAGGAFSLDLGGETGDSEFDLNLGSSAADDPLADLPFQELSSIGESDDFSSGSLNAADAGESDFDFQMPDPGEIDLSGGGSLFEGLDESLFEGIGDAPLEMDEPPFQSEADPIKAEDSLEDSGWLGAFQDDPEPSSGGLAGTADPFMAAEKEPFEIEQSLPAVSQPVQAAGPAPETASLPGWLSDLQDSAPDLGISTDAPGMPAVFKSEAAPVEDIDASAFLNPVDLPDWLSESGAAALIHSEQTPQKPDLQVEGGDISRAELPSWLQAMRPTEDSADGGIASKILSPAKYADSGIEETVGPLAGLYDVLPAEPDVAQFGESHPHSFGDLIVTETQVKHIEMLQEMIGGEDVAVPVQRRKLMLPQQILRWVITALLYAVIFLPVMIGSRSTGFPAFESKPEEVVAATNLVNSIQPGQPVLVAFEYRPGLSGELEAASVGMIDNLISRGANLVIISTQPTGPGLAENFLSKYQSHHVHITNKLYKDMGYVSGGSAALLNFAANPRSTVPLANVDGVNPWDATPLNTIQTIRNFAMVIVITDDSDIARSWVEQVQPKLVDPADPSLNTPMIMVISAQAEPLVRPYFETVPRQIAGLISGIKGGALYETGINERLARDYWDSYKVGIALTILIIVSGSLYYFSRAILTRQKKNEGTK